MLKGVDYMVVSVTDLKKHLGRYLDLVRSEDSLIITKNGVPIAKIIPLIQDKKSALDSLVGIVTDYDPAFVDIKAERLSKQ